MTPDVTERVREAWKRLREADDLIQAVRKEVAGQYSESLMRVQYDISNAQTRLESEWAAHRDGTK